MSMWRAAQRDKVSSIFLSFKRAAGKEKYHKSKKKKKAKKRKKCKYYYTGKPMACNKRWL